LLSRLEFGCLRDGLASQRQASLTAFFGI
jgi:hypothetical protein